MKDALEQHYLNVSPEDRSISFPACPHASLRIDSPVYQA